MKNCTYGVYFDPSELEVDKRGRLTNPEALRIIEFEYNEELDETVAVRRVADGDVVENNPDLYGLVNTGVDDAVTIDEALHWFDKWLDGNTEWRESSPQTYWQPAEYVCIGITGYVDDSPTYHRRTHSWHL